MRQDVVYRRRRPGDLASRLAPVGLHGGRSSAAQGKGASVVMSPELALATLYGGVLPLCGLAVLRWTTDDHNTDLDHALGSVLLRMAPLVQTVSMPKSPSVFRLTGSLLCGYYGQALPAASPAHRTELANVSKYGEYIARGCDENLKSLCPLM